MMRWGPENWRPHVISGFGSLLGLVLLAEWVWHSSTAELQYSAFPLGIVTSVPFVVGLIYAGYWLSGSELPPDQYGRVSRWWIGGVVVTVLLITVINAQVQSLSALLFVGTVRWSAAIGGGVGLTIGVIQAQAVVQGKEAERARRHKQQIELERDQLDEFAKIVSHDLQNPLHIAKGNLELLREECDSPQLETIATAHDRMATITETTLKLARAGQEIDDLEPVAVSAVIERAWEMVESPDATLRVEEAPTIHADETWLQTLLENLFQNAIKHGGDGVTVSFDTVANGFHVSDTGPGIREADHEAIFDPGCSTAEDGPGFGLRIVEKIIEAHGWQMTVTESDQGGARFEVTSVEFAE
jgi:signal transduction histidine kinase